MVEEGEGVIDRYRNGGKVEGCKKKKMMQRGARKEEGIWAGGMGGRKVEGQYHVGDVMGGKKLEERMCWGKKM